MLAKQLIDTIEPQSYAKSCQLQKQSTGLSQLCMSSFSLATPQLPPYPPPPTFPCLVNYDATTLCRTCWYGGSGGLSSGGRVTRSLCSTAPAGPSSLTLPTPCAAPGMTCSPGMSCPSLRLPFTVFALHCPCPSLP